LTEGGSALRIYEAADEERLVDVAHRHAGFKKLDEVVERHALAPIALINAVYGAYVVGLTEVADYTVCTGYVR